MNEKGDLISRQTVLELLQMKYFGKDLYKAIYELPSVENKGDWIPVTERLPETGQRVIVTYETFDEGLQVRETVYDKYGFLCGHGIAWMPLPAPYKTESEDK